MTEQEWVACTSLDKMLGSRWGKVNPAVRQAGRRKLRLFACACLRQVWPHMADPGSRQAVEVAEGYADGRASRKHLTDAHDAAWRAGRGLSLPDNSGAGGAATVFGAGRAAIESAATAATLAWRARHAGLLSEREAEQVGVEQCKLLRDIIGLLPFRPATVSPAWQTPQAVALAQAAYDQRELPAGTLDLARLAVLADALEDAGCDQADLLAHLRGTGLHVRGCWAVDLLLGKS
jgi:hypothetical protein